MSEGLTETLAAMRERGVEWGYTDDEVNDLLSAVENVHALCDEKAEYFPVSVFQADVRKALTDALGSH